MVSIDLNIQKRSMHGERTKLIHARQQKHWTQEQAAGKAGVDTGTYGKWERGIITPRASSLQLLCDAFEMTSEELGFDGKPASSVVVVHSHTPLISAFITRDLSLCLLTLAFTTHHTYREVQTKVSSILEEFDAMNIDPVTRREALKRLAALSALSFPVSFDAQQSPDATLTQCAASIAACQELGRGKDVVDLALAFEGASATLEKLQPIVKDASRHRKTAATVAAQEARLQTVLARHLQGTSAAIYHGQQAVWYSKQADDASEHLITLIFMATAYSFVPQYTKQALDTMEEAVSILKEQHTHIPLYIHGQVYSTLAVMQAKNGQSSQIALRQGAKNAFADQGYTVFLDDPVVRLIEDEADVFSCNGEHRQALDALSQLIDIESRDRQGNLLLPSKRLLSEREHLGVLSRMTLASLKNKKKELERSTSLWKAQMQAVRTLKSEQRFEEAIFAYHLMDALWGDDTRVKELRPLTVHW